MPTRSFHKQTEVVFAGASSWPTGCMCITRSPASQQDLLSFDLPDCCTRHRAGLDHKQAELPQTCAISYRSQHFSCEWNKAHFGQAWIRSCTLDHPQATPSDAGFSPVWVRRCWTRCERWLKLFPQSGHKYGFSPVWTRRLELSLKRFPHWGHFRPEFW
uniref:Uncharacterized protein n=1 Tax=Strix occidentalis caurina TaxID=311401 RepID=A0A8D0KWN6_STROC